MANARIDDNYSRTLMGVTDDSNLTPTNLIVDPTTKRLKCSATLSGTVAIANGGTGTTSYGTGFSVVITDSTGTGYLQALSSLGALGQVLTSNGPGAAPSWSAAGAGMTELNGLTGAQQRFLVGTTGSGFNISSAGTTHTFNLPSASATGTGQLTGTDWTTFNNKVAATTEINTTLPLSGGGDLSANRTFSISVASSSGSGYLKGEDWTSFNSRGSILTFSLPLSVSVTSVSISKATSTGSGYLSGEDWTIFNSKGSVLTFTNPLSVSGTTVSISQATSTGSGYLTSADWVSFNARGSILTFTLPLSVSGTTVSLSQSSATGTGYLTGADWTSFNSRGSILTFSLPLSASGTSISISVATSSGSGYLKGEDWTTFNNKADTASPTFTGVVTSQGSIVAQQGVQFNTTAYFDAEYSNGSTTTAGGTAINWNNGNKQFIGMASTTAVNFVSNPPAPCNLLLRILQDNTANRAITWPTTGGITIRWSGGSVISTGSNRTDVASFYYAGGSIYYGVLSTNFV